MYNTLTLSRDDRGVATLMLNRPEKHNAMSGEMLQELKAAAATLAADRSVRVVVLTGAGKSFCAGGDLGWMQAQMTADAETRAREARVLAEMLMAINTLPQPVIQRFRVTLLVVVSEWPPCVMSPSARTTSRWG